LFFGGWELLGIGEYSFIFLQIRITGLSRMAADALHDPRDPDRITHSLRALLAQRPAASGRVPLGRTPPAFTRAWIRL
jgi:hypothetical protein